MASFILIFRMDILSPDIQPSAEQMKEYMKVWDVWITSISDQGKMLGGNHLSVSGKVVNSSGDVNNQPYLGNKSDSVAGYIIITANSFEEAVSIAEKCPILGTTGNSVEVREIE